MREFSIWALRRLDIRHCYIWVQMLTLSNSSSSQIAVPQLVHFSQTVNDHTRARTVEHFIVTDQEQVQN